MAESKELKKLKKIFKDIPKNKMSLCEKLIDNAAFMGESLDFLKEQIRTNGFIDEYKNGENQFGKKKAAEVDIYNTMIKNYASTIKQLAEMLPEEQAKDELMEFLEKRKQRA